MNSFATYLRMIKFSHTIFALPFALAAIAILARKNAANVDLSVFRIALIVVAFTAMRSFAMAFNRLVDATIDAKNPRTAIREIPSGALPASAVAMFAIVSLVCLLVSAWLLSPLAAYLALPAAAIVSIYSYTKRFTWACHFWLGASIGQAPIAVYLALTGSVPTEAILMGLTLMFYIAGFDILYSLQDMEFDKEAGLYSVPARFGVFGGMTIARLSHVIMAAVLARLLAHLEAGLLSWLGYAVILSLLLLEHALIGSAKNPRYEKIPAAFFNVNSAVSLCYLATLILV